MTTRTDVLGESWLSQVLAQPGNSPNKVAATLRAAGVRGKPHDPSGCPIAQYITERARELSPLGRITACVAVGNATVGIDCPGSGYQWVCTPPPGAVRQFIVAFDTDAAYPDLLAEPTP